MTAKIMYQMPNLSGDAWIIGYEAGVRSTHLIKRAEEMLAQGCDVLIVSNHKVYNVTAWKLFVENLPAKIGA